MREILFRGKRVDNGEWVKGFYVCIPDTHYIMTGKFDSLTNGIINSEAYNVDPNTIGQFTGLTDRNGVKIFEGDIVHVKAHSGSFTGCVTYWLEEEPRFVCETKHGLHYAICAKFEFEVLGNIHDNPELLEVSGNV